MTADQLARSLTKHRRYLSGAQCSINSSHIQGSLALRSNWELFVACAAKLDLDSFLFPWLDCDQQQPKVMGPRGARVCDFCLAEQDK